MPRILVTGFEPFGGASRNPSGEAALALHGRRLTVDPDGADRPGEAGLPDLDVRGEVLPVSWARAVPALEKALGTHRPAAVLALGMAASTFRVEQVADDVRRATPDEDGRLPEPVTPLRSRALSTTLPVDEVEAALRSLGCAVEPSADAGGFLCNHVFLALLERAPALGLAFAGFLHVPAPGHVPPADLEAAVVAVLRAACRQRRRELGAATLGGQPLVRL